MDEKPKNHEFSISTFRGKEKALGSNTCKKNTSFYMHVSRFVFHLYFHLYLRLGAFSMFNRAVQATRLWHNVFELIIIINNS